MGSEGGARSRKQVILSVPQYKTTAATSSLAPGYPYSSTTPESPSLSVTPVIKVESSECQDELEDKEELEVTKNNNNTFAWTPYSITKLNIYSLWNSLSKPR